MKNMITVLFGACYAKSSVNQHVGGEVKRMWQEMRGFLWRSRIPLTSCKYEFEIIWALTTQPGHPVEKQGQCWPRQMRQSITVDLVLHGFTPLSPTNTAARNAAPCTRHFLGTSFGHLGQSRPMRLDGECLQLLRPQQHMGHELQFSSMLAAASWCQPPAKILKGLLECSDWSTQWGVFAEMIWNSECVRCMTLSFYPRRPWLIPVQTSLLNAVPPIHLWNFRNPQWNLLSAWRSARQGGPLMQIHWNIAYFEQFKWG